MWLYYHTYTVNFKDSLRLQQAPKNHPLQWSSVLKYFATGEWVQQLLILSVFVPFLLYAVAMVSFSFISYSYVDFILLQSSGPLSSQVSISLAQVSFCLSNTFFVFYCMKVVCLDCLYQCQKSTPITLVTRNMHQM